MYQPTQTGSQQQISPFVQQMMRQNMAPNPMIQAVGLQEALKQLGGMQNRPMMRSMPAYQNPALVYRPNMQNSQQALGRVVNIAEQRRLQAIENERQRLAAEEASRYSE
jgi:hypothetical protein